MIIFSIFVILILDRELQILIDDKDSGFKFKVILDFYSAYKFH